MPNPLFDAINAEFKRRENEIDLYSVIKEHQELYPQHTDYCLGKDGITLQDSAEIATFLQVTGLSIKGKKPRTYVGQYKRMVGKAADAYVQRKERKESYLGNACYIDRIENFVKLTQDQFINVVKENYENVHPTEPSKAEINSWKKDFVILKKLFISEKKYNNLSIVFEYVLPTKHYNDEDKFYSQLGGRADAIIISEKVVTVFEFKNRKHNEENQKVFMSQLLRYKKALNDRHVLCHTQKVKAVLVYTDEEDLIKKTRNDWICSSSRLSEVISHVLGLKPLSDVSAWVSAKWENV